MDKTTERFFDKIIIWPSGCWMWTAATLGGSYGSLRADNKTQYAHRWAYERFIRKIPDGYDCHHTCKEKLCANPYHIKLVDKKEHEREHAITHCKNGHELTEKNTTTRAAADGGRHRVCIECRNARVRKWYWSDIDKNRETNRINTRRLREV